MYSKQKIESMLKKVSDKMARLEIADKISAQLFGFKNESDEAINLIKRDMGMDTWEWPQGVGLYGLFKYYKITNRKEELDFIIRWFEKRMEEGIPEKNVNTTAPMLTLAYVYEETRNEKYLKLIYEWAEWIMKELPRTSDGGFQHVVTSGENKQQLWDDTLFMAVLFLAKAGTLLGRQDYIEETIKQFLVHIKYLFDRKSGLWFHGWTFIENHNYAQALWARGNCWITAAIPDFIEMIELKGGVKEYLLDTLNSQVEALCKIQEEDGMWHTLLNDKESYVETSATAGFGYGILKSIRKGYLNEKYKVIGLKALNGVISHITEDGTVKQVSAGTGMGLELDHYKKIPLNDMAYGQALTILLLSEALYL